MASLSTIQTRVKIVIVVLLIIATVFVLQYASKSRDVRPPKEFFGSHHSANSVHRPSNPHLEQQSDNVKDNDNRDNEEKPPLRPPLQPAEKPSDEQVENKNENKAQEITNKKENDLTLDRPLSKGDFISERWVIITTIQEPTEDVKLLAKLKELKGFQLLVIGDTKTPSDWSYENTIYLGVEDQLKLGYRITKRTPYKAYTRKNIGYLYAIQHGAKIIYETDDDNHCTDNLNNFILTPTTTHVIPLNECNKESLVFNHHCHYGQCTEWARGYPLEFIGMTQCYKYKLCKMPVPLVQQGIVNGDPDFDALYRLTRKPDRNTLNLTFDGTMPTMSLPQGVFAPFNSQNTLFHYDAFVALLLPTTVTFRVTDIWRGYFMQRVLWMLEGGSIAYLPPNAFQFRNPHSYLIDAEDEVEMYWNTSAMLKSLQEFRCPYNELRSCVLIMIDTLVAKSFISYADRVYYEAWLLDLADVGYKFPKFHSVNTLGVDNICLRSDELPPTEVFLRGEPQTKSFNSKIFSDEPMIFFNKASKKCSHINIKVYPRVSYDPIGANTLLIVAISDNANEESVISNWEELFKPVFPHILYCGAKMVDEKVLQRYHLHYVKYSSADIAPYECLIRAVQMSYHVDNYLMVNEYTLLNYWNLRSIIDSKEVAFNMRKYNLGKSSKLPEAIESMINEVTKSKGFETVDLSEFKGFNISCGYANFFYLPFEKRNQFVTIAQMSIKHRITFKVGLAIAAKALSSDNMMKVFGYDTGDNAFASYSTDKLVYYSGANLDLRNDAFCLKFLDQFCSAFETHNVKYPPNYVEGGFDL